MTEDTKKEHGRREKKNHGYLLSPRDTATRNGRQKKKAENGKHNETVTAKMFRLKTSHVNLTKKSMYASYKL